MSRVKKHIVRQSGRPLKRGWTTGACATAATAAAFEALVTGHVKKSVEITLPKGERPVFDLALSEVGSGWVRAGIIKDAGDDPDVTHGAMVIARISWASCGKGIQFTAGEGVGIVTKQGLPIAVGEPAINPVPRQMIRAVIGGIADAYETSRDVEVEISIPDGETIAQKTWNPRLGIVGGLSILGTTGIVNPFSCSAWIHSIHRGIDVAKAAGFGHVIGSTGSTSESTAQARFALPDFAMIDMGDFVGGMLKYIRKVPIDHVGIAGGPGKITKLAQGHLDLHSSRSEVDFNKLSLLARQAGLSAAQSREIEKANTVLDVIERIGPSSNNLVELLAVRARASALQALRGAPVSVSVLIVDRKGLIMAETDPARHS